MTHVRHESDERDGFAMKAANHVKGSKHEIYRRENVNMHQKYPPVSENCVKIALKAALCDVTKGSDASPGGPNECRLCPSEAGKGLQTRG